MKDIQIREMELSDLESVVKIEQENFKNPWSEFAFLDILTRPNFHSLVAGVKGDSIIGYSISFISKDTLHIVNLATEGKYRGKGIGSKLLSTLLDYGTKLGKKRASLEVRTSNSPAISLYKKFGFQISGFCKRYYSDGENALIMEKFLQENNQK